MIHAYVFFRGVDTIGHVHGVVGAGGRCCNGRCSSASGVCVHHARVRDIHHTVGRQQDRVGRRFDHRRARRLGTEFLRPACHLVSGCLNLARGGRSTSNYRAEGSWEIALKELRSGGYRQVVVLIQFGHNDQPGKPGRSTDLATEFPANLRRYVNDARAAGARPVLVTPLTRRQFERGQLIDDLAPWAAATRAVARELQVPLIDLHARSRALVQGMGPVLAMRLAQRPAEPAQLVAAQSGTTIGKTPAQTVAPSPAPASVAKTTTTAATAQDNASAEPMGQAKLAFDYTHLGADGADLFAAIVADELAQHVPTLRPLLIP